MFLERAVDEELWAVSTSLVAYALQLEEYFLNELHVPVEFSLTAKRKTDKRDPS